MDGSFPPEIYDRIFSFLNARDRAAVMLVSTAMNEACSMRQWADVVFRSARQGELADQLDEFIKKTTKEPGNGSARPLFTEYIRQVISTGAALAI